MSTFVLLLTTLITIGVLKIVSTVFKVNFYWKNKGLPYLPNSFLSFLKGWKVLLGYKSFTNYSKYIYDYFPNAKYLGIVDSGKPAILVRDPELIKNITVKDFEHFQDHRTFVQEDENSEPLFAKNIFNLRGNRWKEMRNTLSPSFTASRMKFMFDLIFKCSQDFVDYLVNHPELCREIETKAAFRRYTNDVIATTAFGISVNFMKDKDNEFYRRGIEATTFSFGVLMTLKLIIITSFPRIAKLLGMTFFPPATSTFFKKIVEETIRTRETQNIVRPDMIHLLMQARDKDSTNSPKMTLDDIVAQAFVFFFAGFDTSSTLMCFVAHKLAVNQDVQDRLREEIQQHITEGNGKISYESLSKMSYMDMVVSETLRKYPPTVFTDRLCVKRYELPPSQSGHKNIIIEPDMVMMFSVYGLHHDPKYFLNPDKFDPERFSEENKDNIVPYTYLPFGLGPRKCIGNRFALMETKILIAHHLQKFTLKAVEKTVEPVVFSKKDLNPLAASGSGIGLEKRET